MILVTGGTGNVGRELVRQLHEGGHAVRVLTRNPAKASFSPGVDIVQGDLTDTASLRRALEGIHQAFLVRVTGGEHFPDIARAMGVKSIVFLSSEAIASPTENAIGRVHLEMEQRIRQSGVKWTFLRPGAYMTNALLWVTGGSRNFRS